MDQTHGMTDLLVVGAGPTGLAAAADALRHGLTVRIVERRADRAMISKALVLHARTMEALELLGAADKLVECGQRFRALHVHTHPGRTPSTIDLLDRSWGDTRYPYWLSTPQYETEQVLQKVVEDAGGAVHWSTELIDLDAGSEHVDATLRGPDGELQVHRARYLLGCDGGRSATRERVGIELDRRDLGVSFALTDVYTTADLAGDEGHVVFADDGLLLVVPMPEPGLWRLIAQVEHDTDELDAVAWEALVQARMGISLGITDQGWFSQFELCSGVASSLRSGRVFLLGDAAHVHSPVGGQGLNTGIQDAHNLIWKLALAQQGALSDAEREALLDSYEEERHPIATAMVRATDRATRALTQNHPVLRGLRRMVASLLLRIKAVKDRLGRGVGMLDLDTAGARRLPNPELGQGTRLYDRVHPRRPMRLHLGEKELTVRPDRVAAPVGTWPPLDRLSTSNPLSVEVTR